jgi:phosphopantothenoylcysteine decarboxylase
VVLAPAMNTLMWEHPLTGRHLRQLATDAGGGVPADLDLDGVMRRINETCPRLRVVPPQVKLLADGDFGAGGLAALDEIVRVVETMLRPA